MNRWPHHSIAAALLAMTGLIGPGMAAAEEIPVTAGAVDFEANGNCSILEAYTTAISGAPLDACASGTKLVLPANSVFEFSTGVEGDAIFQNNKGAEITIIGNGSTLRILPAAGDRAFLNTSGINFFQDLTFEGGRGAFAGAIDNRGGNVFIQRCTFTNNSSSAGPAVLNALAGSYYFIMNSTFSDNHSTGDFDGILYSETVEGFEVHHSTIANNTGTAPAINWANGGPYIGIYNSILANNFANGVASNCRSDEHVPTYASISTDGTCTGIAMPNTDPLLGPLQDNGGHTHTHALLAGSPAIDQAFLGGDITTPTVDQRGIARPQGAGNDIGAFEYFAPDSTPNAFSFTDQVIAPGKVATSNTITVSGINQAAPISVVNGRYSINGGEYTLRAGTVSNGDTVTLRKASSAVAGEVATVTLSIGGVSDAWQVATRDAVPDGFTFTDQSGVKANVIRTSNVITVSGINVPVEMTIVGGKYSRNGAPFTSAKTTVSNGDQIRINLKSSSTGGATVNSTLSIGGVSDTFSVTTKE